MVEVLTDTFRSIEVAKEDGNKLRIDEGNPIRFVTEQGEIIEGIVTKLSGKGDKAKIQIIPNGAVAEQIWSVLTIKEGTLEVVAEKE
jgi:formylmethanofuran dehydrogenase subunit D